MNILVIGSKGFIGSHTIQYFKNLQHNTFGCDVVVDYTEDNYFLLNASNANFQEIFSSQSFDICINCSGAASVPDSIIHPQRDFDLNVVNVFKLLDAIRIHQPKCKFINLSSAAVYGNPEKLPIAENSYKKPVSPYGIHKKMAEEILTEFNTFYHLNTISLRLFSVFGIGLQKQLFWDLHKKMKASVDEIEIYGTGNETRDFIYIKDLMQAIDLIVKNAQFNGEVYNIANGIEVSIREAVETFAKSINWNGKINYTQAVRVGDPLNWRADVTALQQLGYKQKYSLQAGLNEFTQWLREKT